MTISGDQFARTTFGFVHRPTGSQFSVHLGYTVIHRIVWGKVDFQYDQDELLKAVRLLARQYSRA